MAAISVRYVVNDGDDDLSGNPVELFEPHAQ
jgi:hypothetical protein